MNNDDINLDELRAELDGLSVSKKESASHTPREQRIIAGFEDIERFFETHGRLPGHDESNDIFERLYAVRLDKIRSTEECMNILAPLDKHGILEMAGDYQQLAEEINDDELLAELSEITASATDVSKLTHVRPRAEIRAAEDVAKRVPCRDFDKFKPIFDNVQDDLQSGIRTTRPFKDDAQVLLGQFFILSGQKTYIAHVGEEFINDYGKADRRLRVIYDNGTEIDILLRSFQRALNKDDTGRRISDPAAGPLFANDVDDTDHESGTIYVLRSKSDHPMVAQNRNIIHKVGVTGGKIETRIANAKYDATYLLADVEIVASYKLYNINRVKLENLLHRALSAARLDIEIADRFGTPVKPKEWFLVPVSIIDQIVDRIQDNTIQNYTYNPETASLEKTNTSHSS